jgi:hypothetical protein
MLTEQKLEKLIDITIRAISVNESLHAEEMRFVEALSEHHDINYLEALSDTINLLGRKEVLYNQVAQMLLKKTERS